MLRVDEEWLLERQQRLQNEKITAQRMRNQRQGAVSHAQGRQFEELINAACEFYRHSGQADIEKTPEPMRPVQNLGGGRFVAYYERSAQPDYKGTLRGGRAVAFEAKSTSTDRITQDRVTAAQAERLARMEELGGVSFVLCQFSSGQIYRVSWRDWVNMAEVFGRKYITEADLASRACLRSATGVPLFLERM